MSDIFRRCHRRRGILNSLRGGSRFFFRTGCNRLLLYFNTNKPQFFFFGRIPVVLENRRSPGGGGVGTPGTHPREPPLSPIVFFGPNTRGIRKPPVPWGGGVRPPCTLPLDPPLSLMKTNRDEPCPCRYFAIIFALLFSLCISLTHFQPVFVSFYSITVSSACKRQNAPGTKMYKNVSGIRKNLLFIA